jgi:hypothetical protein
MDLFVVAMPQFDDEDDVRIFVFTIRRLLAEFRENFARFDDEEGEMGIGMLRINPKHQEVLFPADEDTEENNAATKKNGGGR